VPASTGCWALARVLREETKEQGIRVTSLILGATLTPSWEGTDFPDDRFMPVEDVAEAAISAYRMTGRSVVEEILIRPQLGDI
jgi:short-subunit dehydrogenase